MVDTTQEETMKMPYVRSGRTNQLALLAYVLAVMCCASLAVAQQVPLRLSRSGVRAATAKPADQGLASPVQSTHSPLYTFTFGLVDYPRSQIGAAYGINDSGKIVGGYNNTNVMEYTSDHGFELKDNKYETIDYPGALQTDTFGINKSGEIVGSFVDSSENVHGFRLAGGTYTQLDYPGAYFTAAVGVSASGEIAGTYAASPTDALTGFLLSGGTYTSISAPGSTDTELVGLNKYGVVAGYYVDSSSNIHGFTYEKGTFTMIDYGNGNPNTYLSGIDDYGAVVGGYGTSETINSVDYAWQHGFLYSGGTFNTFDAPFGDVQVTTPWGMNNKGEIVGGYVDSQGMNYGFFLTAQ
jgi:uncharacterized membrane protein